MTKKKRIIYTIIISVVLIGGFFVLLYKNNLREARADASDNVHGFAWSSTMGWASFNCDSSELALPRCSGSDYGVHIIDSGTTGIFSGHAWSGHFGWIDFDEADLAGCPSAPCRAWVDKADGLVYGWGKFLTTGDWVRLRGNGCNVSINKSNGDFLGYAWGGESAGWISFNCTNGSICPSASYKVYTAFDMNIKPTAINLNVASGNMCASPPTYTFSWAFSDADAGDTQAKYQVQVAKQVNNWSGWVAGIGEVDTGVVSSGSLSKQISLVKDPLAPGQLSYNTSYKWRVKVWDNQGKSSSESDWFDGANFSTPTHIYPVPYFDWAPKPVIKDQQIQFSSAVSKCYSAFNVEGDCSGPGKTFTWTIPATAMFDEGTNANSANPIIKFSESGTPPVSLQISDDLGACSTSTNVRVTLPLPKWKEILPQ